VEDDRERHELRAGFDEAAEAYQRTRPVCPPQAFDDLIRLANLGPGDRMVEIGCCTGQATVPLSERGWHHRHRARPGTGGRSSAPAGSLPRRKAGSADFLARVRARWRHRAQSVRFTRSVSARC
jgi:hypothetical protein